MNVNFILKKTSKELRKSGINTAELDTRVLIKYVVKKDESYIFSHPEMPLTNYQYNKFRSLIRRRKKGEPVAYLTGHKEFYGYDFLVNKNVLIPRPETELIVEETIKNLKTHISNLKTEDTISILDIGTGSGCIIVSIVNEIAKLKIENCKLKIKYRASDISRKALYVAKKNARFHKVDNDIRFFHSDLFANSKMPNKYDVIIANLPYVPKAESRKPKSQVDPLRARSLKFEPESAIFARDNGTAIITKFIDDAKIRINKNGLMLIEVDPRNAKEIFKYAKKAFSEAKIELLRDLANLDRTVTILLY